MKSFSLYFLWVLTFCCLPICSAAETTGSPSLAEEPLNKLIQHALEQNAELKAAYNAYQAAQYKIPQVTSLPDPKISYGYFLQSVETRVGPQEQKIGASQSFPWFGTLSLQGEIADAEAKAELNRFLSIKNGLVLNVLESYTELAYADAAIAVTQEMLQLLQSWEQVLQERFRASTGTHTDLVRVQLEVGKLEDKLKEFRDLRSPLLASLNALLNRDISTAVNIEAAFLERGSSALVENIDLGHLRAGNPELRMLEAVREARLSGVALAEKKFFPDFTVGLDYVVTGDRDVAGGGDDAVLGMVSITLPLYRGKQKAALQEAKTHVQRLEEMKQALEFKLQAELARLQFRLRDANRKIALYRKTLVPKTEESIEASYTAYQAGDSGFLEVIDSERRLLDFQLTLRRAQADRIVAAASLEKLAGGFSEVLSEGASRQ